MIDDLKPYPEYKDSGVEWLGKVPGHWEMCRVRYLFREIDMRSKDGSDTHLMMSQRHGLIASSKVNDKRLRSESYIGGKLCQRGELVLNRLKAHLGVFATAPENGVISPDYSVFRSRNEENIVQYFEHLFKTPIYVSELRRTTRGIVEGFWRLYTDDFYTIPSVLPPPSEQRAIVRFLDHADRLIKKYIRAKQKLIKLLEEQKQAIIHRAVTRGLDPNVKLKPSGVAWLGDVPEHWEIAALHHRYSQCLGKMLDSKRNIGETPLPYLRNTDVQWDRISTNELPLMDIAPSEYDRYTVREGDLLVCEGGDVGRCAIWNGALTICGFQKALHRLRPRSSKHDVTRFMYYALRAAAKSGAFVNGHQSTISHLTGDKLRAH